LAAQWKNCADDLAQECPPARTVQIAATEGACTLSSEQKRFLAKPLKEVDLSVRTANCLASQMLARVGGIAQLTESDLLRIPNFGRKRRFGATFPATA
jgi:DNA-directed RNA polymerase alpha subunit